MNEELRQYLLVNGEISWRRMASVYGMNGHVGIMAMKEQAEEMDALKARIAQLETAATKLAEGRLLTSKEVALVLAAHHKTIEKWTRLPGNPLPCIRRGRTLRFRLSDVNRWVAQRKEG